MQSSFHDNVLLNLERLRILRDLALLGDKKEPIYDQLTQYASKLIDAPVSLVSMVAADYQFFKSHTGLPEPWASRRSTPLSHSFCQHVITRNEPLVIEDARENDLVKNNLAIPDLNVIGYLGIPLTLSSKMSLGSFCVIDSEPRKWTENEVHIMEELSDLLIVEFETRANVNLRRATQADLDKVHKTIDLLMETVKPQDDLAAVLEQIRSFRKQQGV